MFDHHLRNPVRGIGRRVLSSDYYSTILTTKPVYFVYCLVISWHFESHWTRQWFKFSQLVFTFFRHNQPTLSICGTIVPGEYTISSNNITSIKKKKGNCKQFYLVPVRLYRQRIDGPEEKRIWFLWLTRRDFSILLFVFLRLDLHIWH